MSFILQDKQCIDRAVIIRFLIYSNNLSFVNPINPTGRPPVAPFTNDGLTLIPAWISNHIRYKVWDEITYPFLNFNGTIVEV